MFSRTSRCEPADVTDRRWSLAGRLRVKAEIIGRRTGLAVITKPVSAAGDAATPVNTVREMGAIGAIFLNGDEADRARRTQQVVAHWDGPVVPTDQDGSRIANTVAPTAPLLRPLLITAGIGRNRPVECRGTGGFRAETPCRRCRRCHRPHRPRPTNCAC